MCGLAAIQCIKDLKAGEIVILGNLRYLTEEVSTFEKDMKMDAAAYTRTWELRISKDAVWHMIPASCAFAPHLEPFQASIALIFQCTISYASFPNNDTTFL